MLVGSRSVGPGSPALVIAEIGNNHDGSVHQAERLIDAAAEAGADAVKFQTHIAEAEMHPSTPTPPHFPEPRWEFTKRMELSPRRHRTAEGLRGGARPAVLLVAVLGRGGRAARGDRQPAVQDRLGRGDEPAAARGGRGDRASQCSLSTGMAGLEDVERALGILREAAAASARPAVHVDLSRPPEQVNLRAMAAMGERLRRPVRALRPHAGHPHLDRGRRARRRRRSRSTSRSRSGCTARITTPRSTPEELARLVDGVRQVEAALGSGREGARSRARPRPRDLREERRHEVAIPAGTQIEPAMLTTKRPGNGIPAVRLRRGRRPPRRRAILEPTTLVEPPTLPERRKVCVVVASRANYARIKTVLEAVQAHPELELQVVAGASLVLERFGNAVDVMSHGRLRAGRDDSASSSRARRPATMAKSTGLALLELPRCSSC